ncbi:alpha beta-hydrolase [Flagelloscypha sp. PMI_526]|nr:alpha beta-hydrolase [Flagelloscypha sp. PMI_526]
MSSVYVPVQAAAALLRRTLNVISSLAVTKYYSSGWSPEPVRVQRDVTSMPSSHSPETSHSQESSPIVPDPPPGPGNDPFKPLDIIHKLIQNPALYDPLRKPRFPIVLCHGLYGFDARGPTSFPRLRMEYWYNVLAILRDKIGAEVVVTSVPSTGSIQSRAEKLHQELGRTVHGRGVNLLAHSMGGLDCRHLISHIKPTDYAPLSLMSICTPHRGSPFMDWCAEHIGIGRRPEFVHGHSNPAPPPQSEFKFTDLASFSKLPSSFTTMILSLVDSPAYANLTTAYLNDVFNPATPDDPTVKYFSVAGRMQGANIWHPFWLPKLVMDGFEERERSRLRTLFEKTSDPEEDMTLYDLSDEDRGKLELWNEMDAWGNDGLVTVQSARWGEFLGVLEGCDHWEMRGARGLEFGVDLPALPALGLRPSADNVDLERKDRDGGGWSIKDWTRFVSAWNKEESKQRSEAVQKASAISKSSGSSTSETQRTEKEQDDEVIRGASDRLSAVFDFLVEHVPTPPMLVSKKQTLDPAKDRTQADVLEIQRVGELKAQEARVKRETKEREQKKKVKQRNDLETHMDLERFYVALSRKLYDEGL